MVEVVAWLISLIATVASAYGIIVSLFHLLSTYEDWALIKINGIKNSKRIIVIHELKEVWVRIITMGCFFVVALAVTLNFPHNATPKTVFTRMFILLGIIGIAHNIHSSAHLRGKIMGDKHEDE